MHKYLWNRGVMPGQHGDDKVHDEVVEAILTQACGQDQLTKWTQPELGVRLENLKTIVGHNFKWRSAWLQAKHCTHF